MIQREERIGGQRLILGDCLKVMPLLGKVDAVVTDPPFGVKRDKGMGGGGNCFGGKRGVAVELRRYAGGWDDSRPDPEVFNLMLSASDVLIIWGGQFFADLLPPQGKWLFWDKCQTMPSFGDGELAWTNLKGDAVKKFTYNGSGLHAKEKERVHPTQKPVALIEWCIGLLPVDADTILDPFSGSGTVAIAAYKTGRQSICIERDPDYFDTACKRVDEATRQPDMFISPPPPPPQQTEIDL